MIFDIDGNELKVGDVCTVVCTGPFVGKEVRITSIEAPWLPFAPNEYGLNCRAECTVSGYERWANSVKDLRKQKPDREDLQKVEWSAIHALGFVPAGVPLWMHRYTVTADGC